MGVTSAARAVHVIGGGVAGLTTALCLARCGLEVHVYERREQSAFAGMGFLLMPNGFEVLKQLLSPTALQALGALEVTHATLSSVSEGEVVYDTTSALNGHSLKRPPLIQALKRCCEEEGAHLHHNTQLTQLTRSSEMNKADEAREAPYQLSFLTDEGETQRPFEVEAHYVIAADGARSPVRAQLAPQRQLSEPLITEFVGVSRCALPHEHSGWLGEQGDAHIKLQKYQAPSKRQAFGWMPLSSDEYIWYAQMRFEESLPRADGEERKSRLLSSFEGWPAPVSTLIEACPFKRTYRWDTCDLTPLNPCFLEGVLLIGDAAHASLTLSSQGVSSALEDARCLAELYQGLEGAFKQGEAGLSSRGWRALCERFQAARSPVWERRYKEARALQSAFLSAQAALLLPVVSS